MNFFKLFNSDFSLSYLTGDERFLCALASIHVCRLSDRFRCRFALYEEYLDYPIISNYFLLTLSRIFDFSLLYPVECCLNIPKKDLNDLLN